MFSAITHQVEFAIAGMTSGFGIGRYTGNTVEIRAQNAYAPYPTEYPHNAKSINLLIISQLIHFEAGPVII